MPCHEAITKSTPRFSQAHTTRPQAPILTAYMHPCVCVHAIQYSEGALGWEMGAVQASMAVQKEDPSPFASQPQGMRPSLLGAKPEGGRRL